MQIQIDALRRMRTKSSRHPFPAAGEFWISAFLEDIVSGVNDASKCAIALRLRGGA